MNKCPHLIAEVDNLRSQLRATASFPMISAILVDAGSGTMKELLLHAERLLGELCGEEVIS